MDSHKRNFWLLWLTSCLCALALLQLFLAACHPYTVDIIGRTLRINAIALSQGFPIYSAPALAMPYTPGFVILNSALIKFFGFYYALWNAVWASGSLIFLIGFTYYFWVNDKIFSPFIPAGLLACLFPFVWARGDIYAILLTGSGMLLAGSGSIWRTALSIVSFSLALLFKQTMLPVILAIVLLSKMERSISFTSIKGSARLIAYISLMFFLLLFLYKEIWNDNFSDIISVFTVGKKHKIRWGNLFFYASIYSLTLFAPCLYVWNYARQSMFRIFLLAAFGLPYILFSAKDGGGWHHFLALLLPWLWELSKIRRNAHPTHTSDISYYFWMFSLLLFVSAYFWFPFRPSIANATDIAAITELRKTLSRDPPNPGDQALFLDSSDAFAFSEPAYLAGYHAQYSRGALEEWSGATGELPRRLLEDVNSEFFTRIFVRTGAPIGVTAYGVSYEPLYKALEDRYTPCPESKLSFWTVLCPRGDVYTRATRQWYTSCRRTSVPFRQNTRTYGKQMVLSKKLNVL